MNLIRIFLSIVEITVYPFINERVNRYTVNFGNMLTLPVTYGKMFLDRKAAVGVWPAAEVKNEARLGEGK